MMYNAFTYRQNKWAPCKSDIFDRENRFDQQKFGKIKNALKNRLRK